MRRLLRWIAIVMGCLVALAIVAIGVVYGRSEWMLRHARPVPAVVISIPVDSASIIEGQRLATIRGCFGGCHGKQVGKEQCPWRTLSAQAEWEPADAWPGMIFSLRKTRAVPRRGR